MSWSTNNPAGAFDSPLKLTVAGIRGSDGSIIGNGLNGDYWSSTAIGVYSRYLYFDNNYTLISNYGRSIGASVRCIQD